MVLVWVWQQWPDRDLHVVFCDVGQGDAVLIVLGSFQALVDVGPSENKLFECLGKEMPFWDRKIDLVFISHPQKDHNGALVTLKNRYKVATVIEKTKVNDIYRYGNLYFDVLSAGEAREMNTERVNDRENEDSVVLWLRYWSFSVLFTADIGQETELAMMSGGLLKKTTILKVPHHGSKNSSSLSFLEKIRPDWAVVSVGAKNSYGHPNEDTLIRLDLVGARILRTDTNGTVEVVTDGERLRVLSEK